MIKIAMFEMNAVRISLILAVIVSFNLVFILNEETLNNNKCRHKNGFNVLGHNIHFECY